MAPPDNIESSLLRRALWRVWRWLYAIAAVAFVLFAMFFGVTLLTHGYDYGTFPASGGALTLSGTSMLDARYAVLGIQDARTDASVIFDAEQWDTVLSLWTRARTAPPQAKRHLIGDLTETDADNARLFVLAGHGIRLVLREDGRCVPFDLPPSQQEAFERALLRVKDHLAGKITGAERPSGPPRTWGEAVHALVYHAPLQPAVPDCGA